MDLLTELPERCRYRTATGPEGRLWTDTEELLASILETVSIGATVDTRLRRAIEVPRPRYPETTISGPASSPAEVAAFFGMVYVSQTAADDQEA